MKNKFDGNNCASVTIFVLEDPKCPGVMQNYNLFYLVKPLHIQFRIGSQTPVVTIYANTISNIWRTNYSGIVFNIFQTCSRVAQYNEQIIEIVISLLTTESQQNKTYLNKKS